MSEEATTNAEIVPANAELDTAPKVVEENINPDELSQEELLARIEASMDGAVVIDEPAVPDDEGEVVEAEASNAEPAAEPEAPSPEPEPVAAQEPQGESEVTEADELRARLEVQEAETKRFESLLGQRAGEDGFHKQRAAQLERELAELRNQLATGGVDIPTGEHDPQPQRVQPQPRQPSTRDQYVIELAVRDTTNRFREENPEIFADGENGERILDPAFVEAAKDITERVEQVASSTGDPLVVSQELNRLLGAAAAKMTLARKRSALAEIQRKRADQTKRLRDKRQESASASPGQTQAPARQKIDPNDPSIPLEEIRKLADAEAESAVY